LKETRLVVGDFPYKLLNGDVAIPWWAVNIRKQILISLCGLPHCRMDLPGPTTSVGTRTDYSVGPWDCPTCAALHLMA
jgi:hypothetical protein